MMMMVAQIKFWPEKKKKKKGNKDIKERPDLCVRAYICEYMWERMYNACVRTRANLQDRAWQLVNISWSAAMFWIEEFSLCFSYLWKNVSRGSVKCGPKIWQPFTCCPSAKSVFYANIIQQTVLAKTWFGHDACYIRTSWLILVAKFRTLAEKKLLWYFF